MRRAAGSARGSYPQAVGIRHTSGARDGVVRCANRPRGGTSRSRQRVTSGRARRPFSPWRHPAPRPPTLAQRCPSPPPGGSGTSAVEVRRSARRRRTVSAYREGDRTVVLIPARMSEAEEQRWVDRHARQARRPGEQADARRRASWPSAPSGCPTSIFDGRARPASVRWVTNQNTRWGSCTPAEGSIRLSHRLQGMPEYVVDYVLAARARPSAGARPRPPLLAAAGGLSAHRAGPRLPRRGGRRRPAAPSARRPRGVTARSRSEHPRRAPASSAVGASG